MRSSAQVLELAVLGASIESAIYSTLWRLVSVFKLVIITMTSKVAKRFKWVMYVML